MLSALKIDIKLWVTAKVIWVSLQDFWFSINYSLLTFGRSQADLLMARSSVLEMKEIISLALNKHFMLKSNYGSKANSVILIILFFKKKKERKNSSASCTPVLVFRDKTEKKRHSNNDQHAVSLWTMRRPVTYLEGLRILTLWRETGKIKFQCPKITAKKSSTWCVRVKPKWILLCSGLLTEEYSTWKNNISQMGWRQ